MIPVRVFTNDNHLFLLKGFCTCFNLYWKDTFCSDGLCPVEIVGYNKPDFELPQNFRFLSMSSTNAPVNEWSNILIDYFTNVYNSRLVIIFLEDYWLYAPVNDYDVLRLALYMGERSDVLRLDLSADRKSFSHKRIDSIYGHTIIESKPESDYLMSFQVGVWDVSNLLKVLRRNESPWDSEIAGTKRVRDYGLRVLGTLESPVKYTPVYRSKRGVANLSNINQREVLEASGYAGNFNEAFFKREAR